jgi:hypothetical protein
MKRYSIFYCYVDFEERSMVTHYQVFKGNSPQQAMYKARREMHRSLSLPESALWQITAYVCTKGTQENLRDKVEAQRLTKAMIDGRQYVRSA